MNRATVRRQKTEVAKTGFMAQAFGVTHTEWLWAVTAPGADHPTAFLPAHGDAVRYAQTLTRRHLAKEWLR